MGSMAVKFKDSSGNAVYPCPYYPIGSIYMSVNNINPTNFFGGTWEQIKDKFLLACGSTYSAGSTGGEATHKLTMKELPGDVVGGGTNNKSWATGAWNNYSGYAYVYTTINDSNNTLTGGTNSQPHNNMPPYLAVYVWKQQPKRKINMSKSIQLKNSNNEKMYPHPYYPVGSIYLSVNNTNPSQWFGGTWEQIAKGRTLVGVDTSQTEFNTVKKTGGEKTHTLTVNEMPSHNHFFDRTSSGITSTDTDYAIVDTGVNANNQWGIHWETASGYYATYAYMTKTGGSKSHNNLQPYFTCYIWCRTA